MYGSDVYQLNVYARQGRDFMVFVYGLKLKILRSHVRIYDFVAIFPQKVSPKIMTLA